MRRFFVTVSESKAEAAALSCAPPAPAEVALSCGPAAPAEVALSCAPPAPIESLALQCSTDAVVAPVEMIPHAEPHDPIPSSMPVSPLSQP